MADQWWSWALSIIGATCFYLAGKKVWWTWYLGLFTQLLWLGYTLVTQQWGFLVGVFLYTFVYSKNARDWTRDHFWPKPAEVAPDLNLDFPFFQRLKYKGGTFFLKGGVWGKHGTYELVFAEESDRMRLVEELYKEKFPEDDKE